MAKSKQFVVPTENGWGIRKGGSDKLTVETETKKEAVEKAIEISKNQKAELTILGSDGKIQSKNSYGNDPNPPKDKNN